VTLEALGGLAPYLALILFGFLPSEIWRMLGVGLSRGIGEDSELLRWVRAVATALLMAVVAKLLVVPSGALAGVPLAGRLGALAAGLAACLLWRRSVFAGVIVGQAVLIAAAWWAHP
jgi:branched-subunit amino acid transport protein